MKKIFFSIFTMTILLFASCTNDDINITTTPKVRTLTYVINTQTMYDELGITSEVESNYLSKNHNIGVYTFVYDAEQNLVTTQSSTESSLGTSTTTFQLEEGTYTIVSYETMIGNGLNPSWSGENLLSTLTFNDNSSNDYHYISGAIETKITLAGGDKTETVSPASTRHLLTLNISTQSMYETFGIGVYENILGENHNAFIGITSLVYDKSGQFVDSVNTYIKTFQSIQQKFSLRDGDYTIVTVETLVSGDNNYISGYWKLDNIQNISTAKLLKTYDVIYYDGIVGTSSCTVSVGKSNQSQTLKPATVGCLVSLTAENFDKSDYSFVAFETKNAPDGIILSPKSSEKYFYANYEASNIWKYRGFIGNLSNFVFSNSNSMTCYIVESGTINCWIGCSKESYINDDDTFDFDGYPEGAISYKFQDGQVYYAYARYRGDEKGCDANVGTSTEILSWIKTLDPLGDALFAEPYITWGGTVAAVKSFMSGYRFLRSDEVDGYYVLSYDGKYKENQIRYWFTSQTDGLYTVVVFFDPQKVGEDDLSRSFSEMGYKFIGSGDGYSRYRTKDNMTELEVGLNNNNSWYVMYYSTSSASARSRTMNNEFLTSPKQQKVGKSQNSITTYIENSLNQCEKAMKFYFK